MEAPFTCCKTKECPNVCCMQCLNIFHFSCLNRTQRMTKIEGHKIICSQECARQKESNDDQLNKLFEEVGKLKDDIKTKNGLLEELEVGVVNTRNFKDGINKLHKENRQKDVYIQRLKRVSISFEEDVFSAEQNYIKKLDEQKQTIAELNKELIKQTELNRHLMTEVDSKSAVEEWLQKDLHDLEISKQNMLKVIESLSQENELFTTELRELRNKNDIIKTKSERTSNTIGDEILGTER
ncbi:unnamed protein product [Phaedon cochleariae]|uniref:Uncharacterized protein n=1 Tax=Phaedon cochleariae TaxID=80249 RepID=A0A9N9SER8_PHACE|nr:unnamed protein product [Phaedon cochleariae]